ncbi:hypothetical protein EVAR_102121_1 [Eumeta japonica]|uniref:Uncharacterized protein n=1 Tax=Eumeta variegata TaxID=151549 RepID=A0A4C1TZQ8_EUMVA|nr:hypothetical protein EVAR_102121_1 [Eumeta japonica]
MFPMDSKTAGSLLLKFSGNLQIAQQDVNERARTVKYPTFIEYRGDITVLYFVQRVRVPKYHEPLLIVYLRKVSVRASETTQTAKKATRAIIAWNTICAAGFGPGHKESRGSARRELILHCEKRRRRLKK